MVLGEKFILIFLSDLRGIFVEGETGGFTLDITYCLFVYPKYFCPVFDPTVKYYLNLINAQN